MASLQERGGTFRVIFRHHGKPRFVSIGSVSRQEAEAKWTSPRMAGAG